MVAGVAGGAAAGRHHVLVEAFIAILSNIYYHYCNIIKHLLLALLQY